MLECFVFRLRSAHLQSQDGGVFKPNMNAKIEGYNEYKMFWDGKGGHGHAKGNPQFQTLTSGWSSYGGGHKMSMAVKNSQAVKDYTDRANYIYWCGSSSIKGNSYNVNIAAKWNDDKTDIEGVSLYYSWDGAKKQLDTLFFSLQSLGLYQSAIVDELKLCLDLYTEMRDNPVLDADSWKDKYKQKESMIKLKRLLESNYNLILTGAPGTGKTYLARKIAASMIGCTEKELNGKAQFKFVQFHPSYDYTDFVEGLRPEQEGNNVVFKRKDGIFKDFCVEAAKAEKDSEDKRKFVFVIDEINRGEISKIFGELFFSIDPGYRDKDRIPVKTQYQNLIENESKITDDDKDIKEPNYYPFKKGFYVPSNVYVIGTMNDIDRSVESMDFAFRRRFAFHEIKAVDTQESILADLKDVAIIEEAKKRMDALNDAVYSEKQDKNSNLLEGFSAAYHIGAAYFKKIEMYGNNGWEELWNNHINGVLFEYLRGTTDATTLLIQLKNIYDLKNADGTNK